MSTTTISAQEHVDQLVYRLYELMPAHAYYMLLEELQDRGVLFYGEGFLYTEDLTLPDLYRTALEIALDAEPEPRTHPIVLSSIQKGLPEGYLTEELVDFIYELVEREWLIYEEDGSWSVFTDFDVPGTFRSWFGYPLEGSD